MYMRQSQEIRDFGVLGSYKCPIKGHLDENPERFTDGCLVRGIKLYAKAMGGRESRSLVCHYGFCKRDFRSACVGCAKAGDCLYTVGTKRNRKFRLLPLVKR